GSETWVASFDLADPVAPSLAPVFETLVVSLSLPVALGLSLDSVLMLTLAVALSIASILAVSLASVLLPALATALSLASDLPVLARALARASFTSLSTLLGLSPQIWTTQKDSEASDCLASFSAVSRSPRSRAARAVFSSVLASCLAVRAREISSSTFWG